MLFGDVNAHTAVLSDYIIMDDFLARHFDLDEDFLNTFNSANLLSMKGFPLSRASKDSKTNALGAKCLDTCKCNNLFIVNGRVGHDKNVGNYTFRNTSVIDYALATANCFEYFLDFKIEEVDPLFSDGHSLLSLTIQMSDNTIKVAEKFYSEENETIRINYIIMNSFY